MGQVFIGAGQEIENPEPPLVDFIKQLEGQEE